MNLRIQNKWVIGLTGSILSGKSTALAYFAQCGAAVFSCDEIVRQLYKRPTVLKKIQQTLGTADSAQLAQWVFVNTAKRKQLEGILHPLVFKELHAQIKRCQQPVVVVEVPLLFEAGWDTFTDLNVLVLAGAKTLPARLKERHMTRTDYKRRLQTQLPEGTKVQRADIVFQHTNKAQLKKSVTYLYQILNVLHSKPVNRSSHGRTSNAD